MPYFSWKHVTWRQKTKDCNGWKIISRNKLCLRPFDIVLTNVRNEIVTENTCIQIWAEHCLALTAKIQTILRAHGTSVQWKVPKTYPYRHRVMRCGNSGQSGRIDAILKPAYKCGFSKNLITVTELLTQSSTTLFRKIKYNPSHCLSTLLPPKKSFNYSLKNCDFNYEFLKCTYTNHKQSFINHGLFNM